MSNQNVDTVTTAGDRVKVAFALLAVVAGLAGFYALARQPLVLRVASVLAGLGVGAAIAWFSEPGRRFLGLARESYIETRRVTWPSGKETMQTTLAVFAFVVVMALFLWTVDKSLEWVLYDLILGWKK